MCFSFHLWRLEGWWLLARYRFLIRTVILRWWIAVPEVTGCPRESRGFFLGVDIDVWLYGDWREFPSALLAEGKEFATKREP
jgi:hypothetical protein